MAATGEFAVPTFDAVAAGGHQFVGLITQPDRPAGRGRQVTVSRIKQMALGRDVPVMQPERIGDGDVVRRVAEMAPDVLLVVAYGQLIPAEIRDLPALGAINVHGSLLPELRGAAPCNWAIIRGLRETGVTVQRLAAKMDAGDILAARREGIGSRETAPELTRRLAVLGAELVLDVLGQIEAGTAEAVPQDESRVTYAPRLKKEDGIIDWRLSARRIDCMVRGLKPWPGAYTCLARSGKGPLRIILDEVVPGDAPPGDAAAPGSIVEAAGRLVVAAGEGRLDVQSLKPESGKVMSGKAFCNGHHVCAGDRFETAGS